MRQPRIRAAVREDVTRSCRRCQRLFDTSHDSPKEFCTAACEDTHYVGDTEDAGWR